MAYWHSERLSAQDASFLDLEDANVHMHVGSVALYELGPLARPDGSLDFESLRDAIEAGLSRRPRLRQTIERIPLFGQPVWVDDDRFNLTYHLRHTSLPRPGDERRLKRLAGRIMSQQLDPGKPLWELWFVDGVGEDRFAVITKFHHCMADGISSLGLMAALMQPDPDATPEPAREWISRPAPGPLNLFFGELKRRANAPLAIARELRGSLPGPGAMGESAGRVMRGLGSAFSRETLAPASSTPLNVEIGPHRRIDWTSLDLEAAREVQGRLGGTLNDVVLSVASGALRRFLETRGLRPDQLDIRAAVPVSLRDPRDRPRLGNRVSSLVVPLCVDEPDPVRRLERIAAASGERKGSGQAMGAEVLAEISDALFPSLFTGFARLAARLRSANLVISNVPGPQTPVFLLGARMLAAYPVGPLLANQALEITVFSYAGRLYWGFNSDWDALPDLHQLALWVDSEFELLRKAAAPGARGGEDRR